MLIVSPEFKCSNEMLTITAMMSGTLLQREWQFLADVLIQTVPNIWVRPNNQRREADAAKQMLTVPDGDHLTLLNVYNQYIQSEFSISCENRNSN